LAFPPCSSSLGKFEFLKISGELRTAGRRGRLALREAFVPYAKQCERNK
jgi:hypothetical protein